MTTPQEFPAIPEAPPPMPPPGMTEGEIPPVPPIEEPPVEGAVPIARIGDPVDPAAPVAIPSPSDDEPKA